MTCFVVFCRRGIFRVQTQKRWTIVESMRFTTVRGTRETQRSVASTLPRNYHQTQTKLWEGNVFTGVYLSFRLEDRFPL